MAEDRPIFRSLIAPADCAVILIGGPGFAESDGMGGLNEPLAALLEAAERRGVPALLLAREKDGNASGRCPVLSYRPINPLADPDVRRALAVFDRPRLIIGGDHAETAASRMIQAGAVPASVPQVVYEWRYMLSSAV